MKSSNLSSRIIILCAFIPIILLAVFSITALILNWHIYWIFVEISFITLFFAYVFISLKVRGVDVIFLKKSFRASLPFVFLWIGLEKSVNVATAYAKGNTYLPDWLFIFEITFYGTVFFFAIAFWTIMQVVKWPHISEKNQFKFDFNRNASRFVIVVATVLFASLLAVGILGVGFPHLVTVILESIFLVLALAMLAYFHIRSSIKIKEHFDKEERMEELHEKEIKRFQK